MSAYEPAGDDLAPLETRIGLAMASLQHYPRVAWCPPCRQYAADLTSSGTFPRSWDLAAATLAFHDCGHLVDVSAVATQHFGY